MLVGLQYKEQAYWNYNQYNHLRKLLAAFTELSGRRHRVPASPLLRVQLCCKHLQDSSVLGGVACDSLSVEAVQCSLNVDKYRRHARVIAHWDTVQTDHCCQR